MHTRSIIAGPAILVVLSLATSCTQPEHDSAVQLMLDGQDALSPGAMPPEIHLPAPIDVLPGAEVTTLSSNWDGRILMYGNPGSWFVSVFRAEALGTAEDGTPDFSCGCVLSPAVFVESDATNPGSDHFAFTMAPDPAFPMNPYPSDASGTYDVTGSHNTYRILLYHNSALGLLGFRSAEIIVSDARTADAGVASFRFLSGIQLLRTTRFGFVSSTIEPSITFDGRLIVFHGPGGGRIGYVWNETPGRTLGWSEPQPVSNLYHVDRDRMVDGIVFHERFPIAKTPFLEADGGRYEMDDLFFGFYPWISQDGSELMFLRNLAGTQFSNGGTAIVGRATGGAVRIVDGPTNPDRYGLDTSRTFSTSPGMSPGMWKPFRGSFDVPIPYSRNPTVLPFLGITGGVGNGTPGEVKYSEIVLDDFLDGDYALVLHMNESVGKPASGRSNLLREQSPDTSGNNRHASLNGAWFFNDYFTELLRALGLQSEDLRPHVEGDYVELLELLGNELDFIELYVDQLLRNNKGAVGQAALLNRRSSIRAPLSSTYLASEQGFSVGAFVMPLENDDAASCPMNVMQHGQWRMSLGCDGALTLHFGRSSLAAPLPTNRWSHVAMTYDRREQTLSLYVDGERAAHVASVPPIRGFGYADSLVIGATSGERDLSIPLALGIDEVWVSAVPRTESEVALAAYRRTDVDDGLIPFPADLPLPLGLERRETRIPASNVPTAYAVYLGQQLFVDPRLSADGTIACVTCHDPERGFGDGLPTSIGITGIPLRRNAPTTINRALSTHQFWDGRAPSLEEQAILPIENPDEMGSSVAEAVRFLNGDPGYRLLFQQAYGEEPSAEGLGRAIASFERILLSGNSRVDQYRAGDERVLNGEEILGMALFNGKARCVACHSGSNYTDEAFHNTSFASDPESDLGRFSVTERGRDHGAFKTPTLRDIAASGPYLHDGSVETLEEIVELYDRGGRREAGRDSEVRPLGLSAVEKRALVAFLRALTRQ